MPALAVQGQLLMHVVSVYDVDVVVTHQHTHRRGGVGGPTKLGHLSCKRNANKGVTVSCGEIMVLANTKLGHVSCKRNASKGVAVSRGDVVFATPNLVTFPINVMQAKVLLSAEVMWYLQHQTWSPLL